jgi:hypothetical protein
MHQPLNPPQAALGGYAAVRAPRLSLDLQGTCAEVQQRCVWLRVRIVYWGAHTRQGRIYQHQGKPTNSIQLEGCGSNKDT